MNYSLIINKAMTTFHKSKTIYHYYISNTSLKQFFRLVTPFFKASICFPFLMVPKIFIYYKYMQNYDIISIKFSISSSLNDKCYISTSINILSKVKNLIKLSAFSSLLNLILFTFNFLILTLEFIPINFEFKLS